MAEEPATPWEKVRALSQFFDHVTIADPSFDQWMVWVKAMNYSLIKAHLADIKIGSAADVAMVMKIRCPRTTFVAEHEEVPLH